MLSSLFIYYEPSAISTKWGKNIGMVQTKNAEKNFLDEMWSLGGGFKKKFFISQPIVSLHIEKVVQFSTLVFQSFLRTGASWEIQLSQQAVLRNCNVLEDLSFYF